MKLIKRLNSTKILTLTENCKQQLKKILENGEQLRIKIDSGGCHGFIINFELESELNFNSSKDILIKEEDKIKVVINKKLTSLINGSKLEFSKELIKEGFCIIDNPNIKSGCGCGISFEI